MASTEGGMDIEEVASDTRENHQGAIDPATGIMPFHARKSPLAWASKARSEDRRQIHHGAVQGVHRSGLLDG